MIKLQSIINTSSIEKVLIEEDSVAGWYIYVYETSASKNPERDYLQDTLDLAKECCLEDFGVPLSSWKRMDR